jgi:protein-S-isoprenylcysteine O-methyltransferase Ste14
MKRNWSVKLGKLLVTLTLSFIVIVVSILILNIENPWPFELPKAVGWLGWIFVLLGMTMILLAEIAFISKGGATGVPGDPTHYLVEHGIYHWTRNPIYLGGFLELLGIAFLRSSFAFLLTAFIFIGLMHFFVIFVEEPRTEEKFTARYRRYKSRVPRWIPRIPHS